MNLFSRLFLRATDRPQTRCTPAPKPASRFRPQLEGLEGRDVPSTFYAATASDLVQDIQAANQQGGANAILLTAPTSSPYVMTKVDHNSTDGATTLPQISSGNDLTILTSNGTSPPGYGDTLDAAKLGRLVDVAAGGSLTLQNVTLQNGYVVGFVAPFTAKGGAVENHGTLVLSQVTVRNCAAAAWLGTSNGLDSAGGGIWSDGSLTVNAACVFSGNSATGGGGGGHLDGGSAYGGAICIAGGTAIVSDSFFGGSVGIKGNAALSGATSGGKYRDGSAYGGAIYVAAGTVTLASDTIGNPQGSSHISSNVAEAPSLSPVGRGYGGGVYAAGGSVTLTNDTIQYNVAGGYAGGGVGWGGGYGSYGYGGGIGIAPGANVYLDSFTVAHTIHNSLGNIYGTYTLLS